MSDDASPTIGFIGLGSMGGALVQSICRAGHHPVVFDLDRDRVDEAVGHGAVAADSVDEVGERSQLVGICVPADAHVDAVLDGGLLDALAPGTAVALHSTLHPDTVRGAAERAAAHDVAVVEAPVTGGEQAAAEGRLTFLLGGDGDVIARAEPILAACAGLRVPAGPLGNANLLKLCINLQTYVTHLAVHEAAGLAQRLDLPLDGLKAAMEANGQLGELTRKYLVAHEMPPEVYDDPAVVAMLEPNLRIIAKDIGLMERVAAEAGQEVPGVLLARDRMADTYFLKTWEG